MSNADLKNISSLEKNLSTQGQSEPAILMVDDYPAVAEPIARLLRHLGYCVNIASSSDEGMRLLRTHRPQLVILDLFMPRTNGLDILKWMRGQDDLNDIPVIIYTSANDSDLIDQCMKAGANEVWQKGDVNVRHLVSRVTQFLPPVRK